MCTGEKYVLLKGIWSHKKCGEKFCGGFMYHFKPSHPPLFYKVVYATAVHIIMGLALHLLLHQ